MNNLEIHEEITGSVCAVVVTHNRLEILKQCVAAILNQTRKPDRIWVINNSSSDGTETWLQSREDMDFITQENLGGAGGFSTGFKIANEADYDWVWAMDDDVIPEKDSLEKLLEAAEIDSHARYYSSRVIDLAGRESNVPVIFPQGSSTQYPQWGKYLGLGLVRVKYATFVSLLVNKSVIRAHGYPHAFFFIWGDDYEYTARLAGDVGGCYVGNSVVKHLRANPNRPELDSETNPLRIRLFSYMFRNDLLLKRLEGKSFFRVFASFSKSLILSLRFLFQKQGLLKFRTTLKGLYQGISFPLDEDYFHKS